MKFSEKRVAEKRSKLLRLILSSVIARKGESICIKPKEKGVPNFSIEDMHWLEKELEKPDICMLGYVFEDFDTDQKHIGWVSFGPNPIKTWLKHLEMVDEVVNAVSGNQNIPSETIEHFVAHSEEVRLDMEKRFKVSLPPYSHKTIKQLLN